MTVILMYLVSTEKSNNTKNSEKSTWIELVGAVKTPMGFFVFTMLLVEAFLSIAFSTGDGVLKTIALGGMLAIVFLVILIVSIFGYKNNNNLFLAGKSARRSVEKMY